MLAILTAVAHGLQNSSKRILFDHLFRSILDADRQYIVETLRVRKGRQYIVESKDHGTASGCGVWCRWEGHGTAGRPTAISTMCWRFAA